MGAIAQVRGEHACGILALLHFTVTAWCVPNAVTDIGV